LGEETTELLDRIDEQRALWESTEDDRKSRQRLVAMLLAGGAMATLNNEGSKVLSLIERAGLFVAGGVVVGTLAFRAYANMLGIILHRNCRHEILTLPVITNIP